MTTTITDPPRESFKLSRLLYDTRYRSLTIQVIASILIVLGLAWLVTNTVQNLEALGKDFNFGFLGNPAGYDISQRLVEYDSQSTHARAALVGILNTLLVSFLGIFFATSLGFIMGIARLSHNWIIAKIAMLYIEIFRNIPVLLQIFFWYFAVLAALPRSHGVEQASDDHRQSHLLMVGERQELIDGLG